MNKLVILSLLLLSCVMTKKIRQPVMDNGLPPEYWCFNKPCYGQCCHTLGCMKYWDDPYYMCQFTYVIPEKKTLLYPGAAEALITKLDEDKRLKNKAQNMNKEATKDD